MMESHDSQLAKQLGKDIELNSIDLNYNLSFLFFLFN